MWARVCLRKSHVRSGARPVKRAKFSLAIAHRRARRAFTLSRDLKRYIHCESCLASRTMTSISHPVFTAIVFVSVLVARGESGARQRARIMIVIEARGLSSSSYPRPPVSFSSRSPPCSSLEILQVGQRVSVHRVAGTSSYDVVPCARSVLFAEYIRTYARMHARVMILIYGKVRSLKTVH